MTSRHGLSAAVLASAFCACISAAGAAVTFIGQGSIPGNATDQSGLSGLLEDGVTPRNLAGGFGSAITYSGRDNRYVATPDRGPADGATTYIDRIYTIKIALNKLGADQYEVKPSIVSTKLMRRGGNTYFTGYSQAFDETGSTNSLRFDPEGVRVSHCGETAFVSDEYGPYVYEFDLSSGKRLRSLNIPNKFLIDIPYPTPPSGTNLELVDNAFGRQANRGMEGLAISPDGSKLYGIMQSALLQDGALNETFSRRGINNRIVEIDIKSGDVREFLYQLEDRSYGVSEILAINDHEFLVLERDGNAGASAAFKKLFKIDITNATDIRSTKQLPQTGTPPGVTPVTKTKPAFLDLLDPVFGLAGASFPEKIEGLAFGPDLADGRHLLIVTSDNDFMQTNPSRFFAFAIDPADIDYQPQQISKGGPKCKADDDDDHDHDRDDD